MLDTWSETAPELQSSFLGLARLHLEIVGTAELADGLLGRG
jgi:hypothetical protein